MHPATTCFDDWFWHKAEDHPFAQRHFARHLTKENDVIDSAQRVIKGERIFELRAVIFCGDHVELEAKLFGHIPDCIVETTRIGEGTCSIDHAAKAVVGNQFALVVVDKGKRL